MKKIDLENKLNEMTDYINRLNEKHKSEFSELTNKYKQYIEEKEELDYNSWKEANQKFLKRFIKETIKENLKIEIETSYGGYVRGKLTYNDILFNSDESFIDINRNGLEE